jgi:hypothetical protein
MAGALLSPASSETDGEGRRVLAERALAVLDGSGASVTSVTSVTSGEPPAEHRMMHVYAQDFWHAPVAIVGNAAALEGLRGAVQRALDRGQAELRNVFASDGEGHSVLVVKSNDVDFDGYPLPYTDDVARDSRAFPESLCKRFDDAYERLDERADTPAEFAVETETTRSFDDAAARFNPGGDDFEIRLTGSGFVDEIVARRPVYLHVEQMTDRSWWLGFELVDGSLWHVSFSGLEDGTVRCAAFQADGRSKPEDESAPFKS